MNPISKITIKDFEQMSHLSIHEKAHIFQSFVTYNNEKHLNNYRIVSVLGAEPNPHIIDPYDGTEREVISFVSNDYLGFSKHPRLIKASIEAIQKFGTGAGSSPLIGGLSLLHDTLDKKIAAFFNKQAAITYTSGYAANCGTLSSLIQKTDMVLIDMGVHASVIEGCMHANRKFFLHNDLVSLQRALEFAKGNYPNIFIVVDGVYSQDGDMCDLPALCKLKNEYGAYLIVDDAHGTGVVGATGKGVFEHYGIYNDVDMITGTFSKTFGSVGGFAAASHEIIQMLKYISDSNIFSAAATPQSVAAVIEAIDVLVDEPIWHMKLQNNIRHFKYGLNAIGVDSGTSCSAIFPVMIRDEAKTMEVAKLLLEHNVYANPILYPAVSRKQTRIRMSLMATHTTDMLDHALNVLETVLRKCNVQSSHFRDISQAV